MAGDSTRSSAIVVVPTYDEADNIAELAERLLAVRPEIDVLIVDDDSPDGTGAIADGIAAAEPRFDVMHRTGGRGYASACRDGIAAALERGYSLVLTMDGDLSHDPAVIPELLRLTREGADLAIGSRYVPGGGLVVDWGPMRRAVSRTGSRYARAMIGTSVNDCTSGFRCYGADALRRARVEDTGSQGYFFQIEALSSVVDTGGTVVEVPITYVDRRAGTSKISNGIVLEAFAATTRLGIARLLGRRRRPAKG